MPIHPSTNLGDGVQIFHPDLVNIYGATIGQHTRIGPFVEIQRGATIGARCKIQSHAFIPDGVTIEDDVFIGHGVMFTNDVWPRLTDNEGKLVGNSDWELRKTLVKRRASIGSGATLLPIIVGEAALIGAGAVVTADVADYAVMVGNPARKIGDTRDQLSASVVAKKA